MISVRVLPVILMAAVVAGCSDGGGDAPSPAPLFRVGAAAVTITPEVSESAPPVWIGGYRQARQATGVHDDLFARTVVVDNGKLRVALVAVDLVGIFLEQVQTVREQVARRVAELGVDHVIVAATHNHESPDTLGLWGPSREETGVHLPYQRFVEHRIVASIATACARLTGARIAFGLTRAAELIVDSREPVVIDDRLLVMEAVDAASGASLATLVNFASHVESLGRNNTLLTADFAHYLVQAIENDRGGVALFFPGAVGGLLTPRGLEMDDPETGQPAPKDSYRNAELYGQALARHALQALETARPSSNRTLWVETRPVTIRLDNPRFQAGVTLGIIGGGELGPRFESEDGAWLVTTEVGLARIGNGMFLLVPGEIYPELIKGGIPDPAVAGADFPDAPVEPPLLPRMSGEFNFVLGLANDEIGYLIPRRQWDDIEPYAYGRDRPQYGERNSVGPEGGPAVSAALHALLDIAH